MDIRWIDDINEFQGLAGAWDEALERVSAENPFLLSDFILTWWKHYGNGLGLRILAVVQEGRVAGGLPLYLQHGRLRQGFARVLRYIGGTAANYTEPFLTDATIPTASVLEDALLNREDWDALFLSDVRAEHPLIEEGFHRPSNGRRRLTRLMIQDHMNWAIDLSGGLEPYLATRSKKLLRDLRAKRRHATTRYGEVTLRTVMGREEVERLVDLYAQFSRQAFESRNRRSNFEDPRYAAFFRDWLLRLDAQRRLDAHALMAGETVLAISFGYRFGTGFNWVLTSFNDACRYVRPGYLLIEELIKETLHRGQTLYNWYGYERFYKEQWCNVKTPLYRVALIQPSWRGAGYRAIHWAEQTVKSRPRLRKFVHALTGA